MMLSNQSWELVKGALLDAIQQDTEFVELARKLNWPPGEVLGYNDTPAKRVQAFIQRAERLDKVRDLIVAAREINNDNQRLARALEIDLVLVDNAPRASAWVTKDQLDDVVNTLSARFEDPQLEAIIRTADRQGSRAWGEGSPTRSSLPRFVEAAAEEGWLFPLLRTAIQRAPDDAEVATLGARVGGPVVATAPEVEQAWKKALQRRMLSGGYFMINRSSLRTSMSRMMPTIGNRILVVQGESKTGLSHSVRLLNYLSEVCGGLTVATVDLEEASRHAGPGRTLTPRQLAREIIGELGYADLSLPDELNERQWAAWNVDFAKSFARRADDDPRRVFLVLDAFQKTRLNRATVDFVQVLSRHIGTKVPAFRLVLVGFEGDLPDDVRQARLVDVTSPLTKDDLIEFFAMVYDEAKVDLDLDALENKVRIVLHNQSSYPPGSLRDLSDRVQLELSELSR